MTDDQYDVLDELYFITSFHELQSRLNYPHSQLQKVLLELLHYKYIKCFELENEIEVNFVPATDLTSLRYLATKQGLFAHNTNE